MTSAAPPHLRDYESPDFDPNKPSINLTVDPDINYEEYQAIGKGLASLANITPDGRINVSLSLRQKLPDLPRDYAKDVKEFAVDSKAKVPTLSVVIMIVGSRGDVQPYVALGKRLKQYGHRVRIATHDTFNSFVRDEGLEFFDIGGNPRDLMSYMVKNPGLIPGVESLKNGDISRKRKMMAEMLDGCWNACYHPDEKTREEFAADAIISNPPAFAHIHCAEALGIPLLLSFTMPWCATTDFPHPLVNIKQSNAENGLTNYLSYSLADLLTWQGLGDVINRFRKSKLGLEALSVRSGPGVVDRVKVPWTYCMSTSLVPKPKDWKNHIDLVGFYFLNQSSNYTPDPELDAFLKAGSPPVYIGFGSVVVDDAAEMTRTIFSAVEKAGVRALVSAGWGGLGGTSIPKSVHILGNVPHDWLFQHVAGVCHHGGAGTTAIGLKLGKPTLVIPFFGDQPWWGHQIAQQGAGPEPIHHKALTADNLSTGLEFLLSDGAQQAAGRIGEQIRSEDGVENGLRSFHNHLPVLNMRFVIPGLLWLPLKLKIDVIWTSLALPGGGRPNTPFTAQTLSDAKLLDVARLDVHRVSFASIHENVSAYLETGPKEYDTKSKVSDPITGGGSAIFWTVTHYYSGIAQIFYQPVKGIINTTVAIPRGIMDLVLSVHEGFQNLPRAYGSEVRESGKVTDFSSGLKEAGKGFFYGYYDGITGLVKEPLKGGQKEGAIGAIKGSLRSFANATMRPAAGAVGLVAHPTAGAWKSVRKLWTAKQPQQFRTIRIAEGRKAVRNSQPVDRETIISRFKEASKTTAQRRKDYEAQAKKVLEEETEMTPATANSRNDEEPERGNNGGPESEPQIDFEDAFERDLEKAIKQSVESQSSKRSEHQPDDADFERELEMAKRLSLAEQEGYERGIAEARRRA